LVRQRVRELLRRVEIPRGTPVSLWAGSASKLQCCCCAEIIKTGVEFELAFVDAQSLRFHLRCYEIWEEERTAGGANTLSGETTP
jgi:hypothetical protein